MGGAPKPPNEPARLEALWDLEVLDTSSEPLFDRLTRLASTLLDAPIALVSLVDADRQWFKAKVGLDATETPREHAFCAWAILGEEPLVVPDATADPRFTNNPLVVEEPRIRFYAGAPVRVGEATVGTLCVIDREPRTATQKELALLGELAGAVGEALTLRREALFSARRAQLLAAAEALAGVGHWRLDVRTSAMFWSEQVYRTHGLDCAHSPTLDGAIGAYHPEDRERVRAAIGRAIDEREPFEITGRLVRSDGSVRRVRSIGVPEVEGDTVVGVFGVCQDFTERAELRERLAQAEKLASIGTLAAGVAHEINNPLNYVKVNAITLAEHIESWMGSSPSSHLRELAELVAEIQDGAERIERIVGGLRVFARRSPARLEAVELGRVFRLAERLCGNELRHRARFVLDATAPVWVRADETQLVQVVVNLIVNACHAIDEGARDANTVRARIRREGDWAIFEIRDTGSGMSEQTLREARTPFFTTKEPGVGTGLGLAICDGIVGSLDGELELESVLGQGTSVRVRLPAIEPPAPLAAAPDETSLATPTLWLFVVDDDPLVARSIARIFRHDEVEVFTDAPKALRKLREGANPDVILCDLMMPSMSGAKFYQALRELDPALGRRLVVVTGGAFSEESRAFARSGVPLVRKPVDVAELRAAVAAIAERSSQN